MNVGKTLGRRGWMGLLGCALGVAWVASTALMSASAAAQESQDKKPEAAPAQGQPPAGGQEGQPEVQVKEKKKKDKPANSSDKPINAAKPANQGAGEGGPKEKAQAGPLSDKVKAVFDEMTHDFGDVWAGPPLKHTFKVKNDGTEPLEIRAVKPSCGCTLAGEFTKVVKPGETGEIPLSLKSEALHDKFNKTVTVTTNEKDNATVKLTLVGTAKQKVEMSPSSISFGSVRFNDVIEKTVELKNNTDKPLELKLGDTDKTMPFSYQLTEKDKGKVYELKIATVPPIKEGTHNAEVALSTNFEDKQELKLRVSAVVPPRLALRPSTIIHNPRLKTYPVQFANNGESDVKVLSAVVDDPAITTKLTENQVGKKYTIELTFPEDYEVPKGKEVTMTVKTDDPEKPEVTLPIKAAPTPELRPQEKLVGKTSPSFNLTTVEGKPVSSDGLKDEKGPIVFNFMAGDCGFCKLQLPRLEKLRQEYSDKSVRWVNVAQKFRRDFTPDELKEVVKSYGLNSELAIDLDNKIGKEFKVSSYPTLFVLGKSGNVELTLLGNVGTLEKDLKTKLDQLLGITTTVSAPAPGKPGEGAGPAKPGTESKGASDAKATTAAAKPGETKDAKSTDAKAVDAKKPADTKVSP